MFYSDKFLSRLSRLRKDHREKREEEQIELVRSAFLGLVRSLPEAMAVELFEQFCDRLLSSDDDRVFIDKAQRLADVVDVLAGQYDTENDPLLREEWRLLGEIVSDYATELDMHLVNYVMQLVVAHDSL